MKTIWTEEEPEYHGEFVNFDKMKQWPKPKQKPHPPIIVGGAFPYAARRAIRYGDGWIPRADRLEKDGVGVVIDKFREMATEAGRDPASLPISIFRVPDKIDGLRFCQEIGIDRVAFSLPAEKEDKTPADHRPLGRAEASAGRLTGGCAEVRPVAQLPGASGPGRAVGQDRTAKRSSWPVKRTAWAST